MEEKTENEMHGKQAFVEELNQPIHLSILNKIPGYQKCTQKRDKKKIQEMMRQYDYDDDFIENMNEDFCLGWNAAREIMIQILSDLYWDTKKESRRKKDGR